jgi:putative transposase
MWNSGQRQLPIEIPTLITKPYVSSPVLFFSRFRNRGGFKLARVGDLLCIVLSPPGNSARHYSRITSHPDEEWMGQIARSATQENWGYLLSCRYVLHDRDTKFCASFRSTLASGGVKTVQLPAKSPNLNAFAERWVRSVKQECLSKLILFGENSLSRALAEYNLHYHHERNHQGKGNRLLFPHEPTKADRSSRSIVCHQRLGGLLKYYERAA